MPSSFYKDVEFGNRVEVAWMNHMSECTKKVYEQSHGRVPGWDIVDRENDVYFEVKWDTKSRAVWSMYGEVRKPTGNLFIEYMNPKKNEDTGIKASISKFWVYVVKHSPDLLVDEDRIGEYQAHAHLFNKDLLLDFCESRNLKTRDTKRDVEKGASANARGWLLPWSDVNEAKKESGWLAVYDISAYLSLPSLIE